MGRELNIYIESDKKKTKMKIASLLALAPYALGCAVSCRFNSGGWGCGWGSRYCEYRDPHTNECLHYRK